MINFEQASYLSQVRRLRALANDVLRQYPIKVKSIDFIKHGANAIFSVLDRKNNKYLLRIHPVGYHTKQAILEEIKWLKYISGTSDIRVPKPFCSKDGEFVVKCYHPSIDAPRYCDMFEWVPGGFRWKSINDQYAYSLGETIAKLQQNGKSVKTQHRNYWDAGGLVGTDRAKFHNVENLTGISKKRQDLITLARRYARNKLSVFEKKHPRKSGLIHADLHPNNFIYHKEGCSVIDFDDCGVGLYGYDLAVAMFAFEYIAEAEKKINYESIKESLLTGYSQHMPLEQCDLDMSSNLLLARKLSVLAWLESRKENPRLKEFFNKELKRTIKYFKAII